MKLDRNVNWLQEGSFHSRSARGLRESSGLRNLKFGRKTGPAPPRTVGFGALEMGKVRYGKVL